MTEVDEQNLEEPAVADTPEPDQEPHEPVPDEADEEEAEEQTQAWSEKDVEKALKRIDMENTRHSNRISEIMGEDAQILVPCELCTVLASEGMEARIAGFRFPNVPHHEVVVRVLAAVGYGSLGDMQPSPYHEKCPTCDGMGEYLSHSMRSDQRTLTCEDCQARGWRRREDAPPLHAPVVASYSVSTAPNGEAVAYDAPHFSEAELQARMAEAVKVAKGE